MSWVQTAKVGDKIVCIGDPGTLEVMKGEMLPQTDGVYTIRDILAEDDGIYFRLVEIRNKVYIYRDGTDECAFHSEGFRPVQPRKSDISVFTRLLQTAPAEMEDA